jgi:serine phosphatase RsbU (regulator of sigma subunit)
MGRREPHTMTLGLLVLGPQEIVYYSAGHVPLVLIHDPDAPTHIEAVCGHGNIIGLSVDATIEPIVVPIPKGKPFALMLGSDGVLDFNTRLHRRNIVQLMAEVTAEGREAIVRHAVADDKILVVVEKAAGGAPSKLRSAGREPKPGHSQIEKHGRLKAHS